MKKSITSWSLSNVGKAPEFSGLQISRNTWNLVINIFSNFQYRLTYLRVQKKICMSDIFWKYFFYKVKSYILPSKLAYLNVYKINWICTKYFVCVQKHFYAFKIHCAVQSFLQVDNLGIKHKKSIFWKKIFEKILTIFFLNHTVHGLTDSATSKMGLVMSASISTKVGLKVWLVRWFKGHIRILKRAKH